MNSSSIKVWGAEKCLKTIRLVSTTSLFIENIIKLYEESGKVNYCTNDFFRNHSPEQKINHKNQSGTECTALQRVLFGRFHVSITT